MLRRPWLEKLIWLNPSKAGAALATAIHWASGADEAAFRQAFEADMMHTRTLADAADTELGRLASESNGSHDVVPAKVGNNGSA